MNTAVIRAGERTPLGYHIVTIEEIAECPGDWLFADGGVIYDGFHYPSRSSLGGGWAWIRIKDGEIAAQGSGVLTPRHTQTETITNNMTELYALVSGLSKLPDDWQGTIVSDSMVTLSRRFPKSKFNGIPDRFAAYARQQFARHLKVCRFVLVDGHPSDEQLAEGKGKRGGPVSIWNRWCHEECDRQHAKWAEANPALVHKPSSKSKDDKNRQTNNAGPKEKVVVMTDLSEIDYEDLL